MTRIGIPRMFAWHHYPGLWERFFRELGYEPVVSPPSSRETLKTAVSVTEAEHCLPNKLFDGHVAWLRDRVDMVFIPRIISMVKGHIACPRFGALPEATRDGIARNVRILSIDINVTKEPLERTLRALAGQLGVRGVSARRAVKSSLDALRKAETEILDNQSPPQGQSGLRRNAGPDRYLILGHPYTLRDRFTGDPIIRKLRKLGVHPETVTFEGRTFPPEDILWCSFRKMHDRLRDASIRNYKGVIQISTFNCGADSMMIERFRRLCSRQDIPYMVIMIDEHSGTAGIDTRLEAFIDSLNWRTAGCD